GASWPVCPRPSTSCLRRCSKDVDARHKAGHDDLILGARWDGRSIMPKNNSAGSPARAKFATKNLISGEPALRAALARSGLRLGGQEAFALHLLARELAGAADRFRLFPCFSLGRFFVMAAKLHLAEDALALHFLLERLQGLIDVIVANENLHECSCAVSV